MRKRRNKSPRKLFRPILFNIHNSQCPGSVVAYLEKQGLIIRPCRIFEYRKAGTRVQISARANGPVAQLGRALETYNPKKNIVSEAFNQVVVGSNELFLEIENFKRS